MREKFFKFPLQNFVQEIKKQIKSYFAALGAEEMKILHFELSGCGTENVAVATKFLRYFCLSPVFSSIC